MDDEFDFVFEEDDSESDDDIPEIDMRRMGIL